MEISTLRQAAFLILEIAQRGSTDISDILGTHGTSTVQIRLGRAPTAEELSLLSRAFADLQRRALIRPDIANPIQSTRFMMMPAGSEALTRRALDALDRILLPLGDRYLAMRDAVWDGATSDQWERRRQSLMTMRQMCDEVAAMLAPDNDVRSQAGFQATEDAPSGITRRWRAQAIIAANRPGLPGEESGALAAAYSANVRALGVLHTTGERSREQVEGMVRACETSLLNLVE